MMCFFSCRNLFFRISSLLQLGVKLVFVIEGEAPELKHEEMSKRLQVRNGKKVAGPSTKRRYNRSHFKEMLREVGVFKVLL
jgi:flap endonuclease GEN